MITRQQQVTIQSGETFMPVEQSCDQNILILENHKPDHDSAGIIKITRNQEHR